VVCGRRSPLGEELRWGAKARAEVGHFSWHGLGFFWENVMEGVRQNDLHFYDKSQPVRFANNDGPNFRDHREVALRMFRESYAQLKSHR
jgi:hypothetical protein